jgi:hypothetical protein
LNVKLIKFAVIGLPGRQIRRSDRRVIRTIKLEKDSFLTTELTEADLFSGCARECEVRRLVADLQSRSLKGGSKGAQEKTKYNKNSFARNERTHFDLLSLLNG